MTNFLAFHSYDPSALTLAMKPDKKNPSIYYGETMKPLSFVTPAAETRYPRVTGSGNYVETNPYCPASEDKASFTLDLWFPGDSDSPNASGWKFLKVIDNIDDQLLEFVAANQKRFLGRQNLKMEELRMLQHRNVKQKDDGFQQLSLSCRKYYKDSVGNMRERKPSICDSSGSVISGGCIMPNDIVRATMTSGSVWNVNGKFGLHWELGDVSLVERPEDNPTMQVNAFNCALPASVTAP